jgi:hypothetical protein
MARARADVGEAELLQECRRAASARRRPASMIAASSALRSAEGARSRAARRSIAQSVRAGLVEPMRPIAQCLTIHTVVPRGVGPVHAVQHPASDNNRRLSLLSFERLVSRRNSAAEKSVRRSTADANPLAPIESERG